MEYKIQQFILLMGADWKWISCIRAILMTFMNICNVYYRVLAPIHQKWLEQTTNLASRGHKSPDVTTTNYYRREASQGISDNKTRDVKWLSKSLSPLLVSLSGRNPSNIWHLPYPTELRHSLIKAEQIWNNQNFPYLRQSRKWNITHIFALFKVSNRVYIYLK